MATEWPRMAPCEFNERALALFRRSSSTCQQFYVRGADFESHMGGRGIRLGSDLLETLEREEVFLPMLRLVGGPGYVDRKTLSTRAQDTQTPEYGDYVPWQQLRYDFARPAVFYHPVQFHAAVAAYNHFHTSVRVRTLLGLPTADIHAFIEKRRGESQRRETQVREKIHRWYGLALLILEIQDLYLPRVLGRLRLHGLHGDDKRWWEMREAFSPEAVIKDLGIEAEQIRAERERLCWIARRSDPIYDWRHLARLARPHKRERLTASARLAQDYYDLADMFGHFLEDLTGEAQAPTADLLNGSWREYQTNYWGAPIMTRDRKVLTRYLGTLGLVAQPRAALLTEGDTEEAFFNTLAEELEIDWDQASLYHHSLRGAQKLGNEGFVHLLRRLKWDGTVVHLLVDNDQDVQGHVDDLVRGKLLRPDLCTVWPKTFEHLFPTDMLGRAVAEVLAGATLQQSVEEAALGRVRKVAEEAEADAGLAPFREELRALTIELDRYKADIGRCLGRYSAELIKQGQSFDRLAPVVEFKRALRNAQVPWHEWSGFPEDWSPLLQRELSSAQAKAGQ